jgi:hypothetical protein
MIDYDQHDRSRTYEQVETIRQYWAGRGYPGVEVHCEPRSRDGRGYWIIRSNMVNGFPPRT